MSFTCNVEDRGGVVGNGYRHTQLHNPRRIGGESTKRANGMSAYRARISHPIVALK